MLVLVVLVEQILQTLQPHLLVVYKVVLLLLMDLVLQVLYLQLVVAEEKIEYQEDRVVNPDLVRMHCLVVVVEVELLIMELINLLHLTVLFMVE